MPKDREIQALMESLLDCISLKGQHDKAQAVNPDNPEWTYLGGSHIDAIEAATEAFGEKLNELIVRRVSEALSGKECEVKITPQHLSLLREAEKFGCFDIVNMEALGIPEAICDELVKGGYLSRRRPKATATYYLTPKGKAALRH